METANQNPPEQQPGFLQSTTAKIIMVGLLTLVLLIPLELVKGLIYERSERQKEVVNEINQKWGESVYFYGPVLKVPYKTFADTRFVDELTNKVTYRKTAVTEYAYFFPDELNAAADVTTAPKNRANYESVVYTANMDFTGRYSKPDFSQPNIAPENIDWQKATLLVKTNNIKSIKGSVMISFGGKKYTFEPSGSKSNDTVSALETQPIDLGTAFAAGTVPFDLKISYNGSERISIVPIGKMTQAKMASDWHSPKFDGNFLPEKSHITDKGFTANWKVSHFNRPFAQQHFENLPSLAEYSYDVEFFIPVDQYQQNERAAKYGFLVIGLTFLIFFLIQSVSRISIHIFQYSMIGLALIMFYTLLISITEHSSFTQAYIIAGSAVVVMIGLYSYSILKNIKFPVFVTTALAALYTFIYVIIQLEDYALLVGSIGLFLILGAVMYFSRKIDWK